MSFFGKKKNEELFSLLEQNSEIELEEESLFTPSHALTPDEVIGFSDDDTAVGKTGALEALKKRMLSSEEKSEEAHEADKTESGKVKTELSKPEPEIEISELLNDLKQVSPAKEEVKKSETEIKHEKTLLEKCKPFILDGEDGASALNEIPTYKLESVAEILQNENKKTLDNLSEKYEISFDDLGKIADSIVISKKEEPALEPKKEIAPEISFEPQVFEDIISSRENVRGVQTNVSGFISDIDNTEYKPSAPDISSTATIKFTPVSNKDNTARISISSQTRQIDLTGELTSLSSDAADNEDREVKLEQSEFEEYTPEEEFSSQKEARHFLRRLSIKKRSGFLKTVASVFITVLLCVMALPSMSEILLAHTKIMGIIFSVALAVIAAVNYDMFMSLTRVLGKRQSADICAVTATVTVLSYAVAAAFNNEIALDMVILCAGILSLRALSAFLGASYMLSGFKQIAGNTPKRAVKLIDDRAVTFAMAKTAIDGDVLAAAPQRVNHVDGYMKYSTYKTGLSSKLIFITLPSILLSVALGFACTAYFDGIIYGLYSAAAVQCFAAVPVIFLIDNLPLYSAARKLSKSGAMIAGKAGAERIENANAVVLSSEDLFPSGTVILHQMHVLSDNSVDDTIIRAASLTDALGSPLSPIFKKIAGTGGKVILPESDTVKYEDRMGISGWVDNKPLFIGNRTLMEAHGIDVPSVEVDRKLLRQGYFPVYVATENTACALLAVQYNVRPDIAVELRRVSNLGVTMLINSTDPNMTEEMICDYMGLYEDSVKVMSAAGCHMYKNAVTFAGSATAPAAYKGNPKGLTAIISCANRIKKSNILLSVLYVLAAVFGTVLFAYVSFDGAGSLMNGSTLLLYSLVVTAVSSVLYLTQKP